MKSLYKMIANNTDVEYSLNIFETSGISFGVLSTSYQQSSESEGIKVAKNILTKMEDVVMTLDSHIHPRGTAVASGFKQSNNNYGYVPNYSKTKGDRVYRKSLERLFPNRIPSESQIILPNTSTRVYYNSDTMRVVSPRLEIGTPIK